MSNAPNVPTESSPHPALPDEVREGEEGKAGNEADETNHADIAEELGEADETDDIVLIQEPRVWQDDGWTARVIKNEDDDGWAVSMTLDGEPEPALVGPWTMGRNKKDPKPMDGNAFSVLVKTAYEVRRRHEQAQFALLNKSVTVEDADGARVKVTLEIVPDEYDPHAFLRAFDDIGEALAEVRVEPTFKLNAGSAARWIENEYRRPSA